MPSQKQKALRAQIQREAEAKPCRGLSRGGPQKGGGQGEGRGGPARGRSEDDASADRRCFRERRAASTTASAAAAARVAAPRAPRTNPRNVDTEELLRDARDEGEPTPEVVDDVRAPLALRRTLQPPSKPWVGADGRLMAVWECRQSGVFSAPIAVCSSCGYCRPAPGLDEPFDNGAHLFADGLVANEQQVTIFDCRRCLRLGITSRPFAIGGAGRRTAREIEVWQSPPIEPTEEQQLEMKKWARLKNDWNDEDYQKGLEESKITAAAERDVRRDQNRTLLGAHGVRVLEACILDDTCKKRLAGFRRAAAAKLPLRVRLPDGGRGLGEHAPAERGRGGERAPRLRDGRRGDPRARVEPRGKRAARGGESCDRARRAAADAPARSSARNDGATRRTPTP